MEDIFSDSNLGTKFQELSRLVVKVLESNALNPSSIPQIKYVENERFCCSQNICNYRVEKFILYKREEIEKA